MHRLAESKLLAGFIYGDPHMQEALSLVEKRSLKLCSHPVFGKNTMG